MNPEIYIYLAIFCVLCLLTGMAIGILYWESRSMQHNEQLVRDRIESLGATPYADQYVPPSGGMPGFWKS